MERKKWTHTVNFQFVVALECSESYPLYTLSLKIGHSTPQISFINHSFRPPEHYKETCWCSSIASADKVVRCAVMCPHRHVMASLSGCERRALCSCSPWRVPLVVPSRSQLIPGTSQNTALLISLACLPCVINLQSNQYDMATRVHPRIHAFILHVHTHTLFTLHCKTLRPEALWEKKIGALVTGNNGGI